MGWTIMIVLAGATLAGIVLSARAIAGAIYVAGAVVLVAMAGYAWQGSPRLAGKPAATQRRVPPAPSIFSVEHKDWFDRVGPDAQALDTADTLIAGGDADYAIGILRGEIGRRPRSAALWSALGNALVAYADGMVTPPARYAFEQASAAAPDDPAGAYFLGGALAQSGDLDGAEAVWSGIVAQGRDREARAAAKLTILRRIRAAMAGQP